MILVSCTMPLVLLPTQADEEALDWGKDLVGPPTSSSVVLTTLGGD